MRPIILFRESREFEKEFAIATHYFKVITQRMQIQPDDFVICRYSCLPYYKELETDARLSQAKLINSYHQHRYIADLGNWYSDLQAFTPKTYNRLEDVPENGPFILKGETNSKKFQWKTHFYAQNKKEAVDVYCRLQEDGLVGEQNIYIREFVPLKTYMIGIGGIPITEEFRIFVCNGSILNIGYYWANYYDDLEVKPDINNVPIDWVKNIIKIIGKNANFYVIDVAQTATGDWIVIELNDGQMSGLSLVNPEALYCNLKTAAWKMCEK